MNTITYAYRMYRIANLNECSMEKSNGAKQEGSERKRSEKNEHRNVEEKLVRWWAKTKTKKNKIKWE